MSFIENMYFVPLVVVDAKQNKFYDNILEKFKSYLKSCLLPVRYTDCIVLTIMNTKINTFLQKASPGGFVNIVVSRAAVVYSRLNKQMVINQCGNIESPRVIDVARMKNLKI